jgi:hypothetical protein
MALKTLTVEEMARRIIAREIRRVVVLHDNGSRPSMYDLRVGPPEAPEIAVECVGAVDAIGTATWNEGPARGPFVCELRGDWHVVLQKSAKVKLVRKQIEHVLQDLEAEGRLAFTPVDWQLKSERADIYERLTNLRIESTSCFRQSGTGRVDFGMPSIGGAVDNTGGALPTWVSEFLHHPNRSDVLSKLSDSGAPECHVFVPVSFGAIPWSVESYLGTSPRSHPRESPALPEPVTRVWITYEGRGIRWDGLTWLEFDATA